MSAMYRAKPRHAFDDCVYGSLLICDLFLARYDALLKEFRP